MALGGNDNPDNGPQNPFAYVLIPVLGFGIAISVLSCYRYRRRKQRLARLAENPESQRQLEEGRQGRTQLDRGPNVIIVTGEGGRRRAGGRGRRLGLGIGSREEGLNELGEAPPAYMPNAPKPPSEAGGVVENVELTTYSQAMVEAGMSRSPPQYDEEPPAADGARTTGGANGTATGVVTASEETGRNGTGDTVTGGNSEITGTSEETGANPTGDATTTTTTETATATTGGMTTVTSTTNEPTRPPRAVLPPSRD